MVKAHGDSMPLGGADEQKPAAAGTVERGAARRIIRSAGFAASRKACPGDFGVYLPPVLEALGLAELEHLP